MIGSTLLYGPSFSTLRREAFSRASADAEDRPGSVLLFEANDAQVDAHVDKWADSPDRNTLQLNTDGLASFVSKAHDSLVGVARTSAH